MPDTINGKTPEEIKRKLRGCIDKGEDKELCRYCDDESHCKQKWEALAYIRQLESDNESKQKRIDELESRLAQAERERDAAINELPHHCWNCAYHRDDPIEEIDTGGLTIHRYCDADYCYPEENESSWLWRGPCPENTKEKEI